VFLFEVMHKKQKKISKKFFYLDFTWLLNGLIFKRLFFAFRLGILLKIASTLELLCSIGVFQQGYPQFL